MRPYVIRLLVAGGVALIPGTARAANEDYPAMTTAAREVARQVNLMQELFGTNSQLLAINGLFKQTMDFQGALIDFRQQVSDKASREQLYLAFDNVDRKLTAILDEVKLVEKDDAGVKLVCRRLRSAENDLHFAVFAGDGTPEGQAQRLYRQTLTQQAFVESLASNVGWVFARRDALQGWKDDLGELQQSLAALQKLEQKKGVTADELKAQFMSADKNWSKIVQRYEDAKQDKLLLQGFVVLVDKGFARLAPLVGVKDRRAALTDSLVD